HDARRAGDEHAVAGAEAVALEADPVSWLDHQALDLVSHAGLQRLEPAPRAALEPARPAARARRGSCRLGRGRHHASNRMTRAKSASTALDTSSMTSRGTSSSSRSTPI